MTAPIDREPHSLRALAGVLRALLSARGRSDLASNAFGHIAYTDDGTTIYVHVLARPDWPLRRPGQAFVLASADKRDLQHRAQFRDLLHEAWLRLQDDIDRVIRWFDGR